MSFSRAVQRYLTASLFLLPFSVSMSSADDRRIFYSTDDFVVTEFDLKMYLRGAPPTAGGSTGSRARNLQGLSDIYAMRTLGLDADAFNLLSEEEADWIATYAVTMEKIKRFLAAQTAQRMEQTDWLAEAREHYLVNKSKYVVPEEVTLRTLLIRTDDKSEEDALEEVRELVNNELPASTFEALVKNHTEDDAARETGGLMVGVQRGQTVKPFEDAAFALTAPEEISEPVVSQFGVHVIQLIERKDAVQKDFDEVVDDIIAELKPIRAAQYRAGLRDEAREREPQGFVRHTDELDALMEETSDGPLAPPPMLE